jgi:hypothetical protein
MEHGRTFLIYQQGLRFRKKTDKNGARILDSVPVRSIEELVPHSVLDAHNTSNSAFLRVVAWIVCVESHGKLAVDLVLDPEHRAHKRFIADYL